MEATKEEYEIDLLMLLMETLSEVHVFIIQVKRKIAQTVWTDKGKDKIIPSEKSWRTPVL